MTAGFLLIAETAMDETAWMIVADDGIGLQALFYEMDGDMGDMDVAPW